MFNSAIHVQVVPSPTSVTCADLGFKTRDEDLRWSNLQSQDPVFNTLKPNHRTRNSSLLYLQTNIPLYKEICYQPCFGGQCTRGRGPVLVTVVGGASRFKGELSLCARPVCSSTLVLFFALTPRPGPQTGHSATLLLYVFY